MIEELIQSLVKSKNEAADDLLLEALAMGNESEQAVVLNALFRRETLRGLGGVIALYDELPDSLKLLVIKNIKPLHHALRECGRSPDVEKRTAALKLIALGRQGKLAYVLSENLHDANETLSKAAVDAIVALARWVATETRRLQTGNADRADTTLSAGESRSEEADSARDATKTYHAIIENRPEIEQAVARAMDVHRGKHGQELLRAALLLSDWPGSKTLAILHTAKHGGQSPMVRRLQQPPASEHVEAFLLGATHGQLRSHFGVVFSHIEEAPVLDALLRKTHWTIDHHLQLCMHQVTRGTWWGENELQRDIERRDPADIGRVAEWIAISGVHDVVQDERLEQLRKQIDGSFEARLRLLRVALRRPRRTSVQLLRNLLTDADERIIRMAARDIIRRKPPDFENMLLQLMAGAPESVRKVVSRSIGQTGFEQFWAKFDRLDRSTRKSAGRAMLKMLPDAVQRMSRRLLGGPVEQRLKAMQMTQELQMGESLRSTLVTLCGDSNPKLRSKAVTALGELTSSTTDHFLDRVLQDSDARVRANAIEVLESKGRTDYLPLLAQRARAANNRERANAIKAMHRMKVKAATTSLQGMLRDERPEHRISALWTLKQIGWWQLLSEVGRLAKEDGNLRVRRYALGVLRGVAELVQARKQGKAG